MAYKGLSTAQGSITYIGRRDREAALSCAMIQSMLSLATGAHVGTHCKLLIVSTRACNLVMLSSAPQMHVYISHIIVQQQDSLISHMQLMIAGICSGAAPSKCAAICAISACCQRPSDALDLPW